MALARGRIAGIAHRPARRAEMITALEGELRVDAGLLGDHKGPRFPDRAVTLLAIEDWRAALGAAGADLATLWTTRRANLLTEGLRLPRACGARLRVGGALLEVSAQTVPCARMDEALPGLRKALGPEWRGGVCCRVLEPGPLAIGDAIEVVSSPPERVRSLPG